MTSNLRSISLNFGIPLSTLKLNAKILRKLGLIEFDGGPVLRRVKLTSFGKWIVEVLKKDLA
ncbi:MAG: hypothetical protein RMJ18_00570 [Candidatus Aenigmarchaeota archaeon]|nr:hypothetical protein [Candidatus Aenigmarchaeota archaeon]MCX8190901.1 hypothetical protein [Candidatus Aenigmarchaeota archaeon]MDW8159904.1 hypothetical protein [Candidatus Aenigmarchaeota archaeon]